MRAAAIAGIDVTGTLGGNDWRGTIMSGSISPSFDTHPARPPT